MGGIIEILIILIICATILCGLYLHYCSENRTGFFTIPQYNSSLYELEKSVEKLIEEIKELKKKV